jgi:GNAT superfamily N-acetyltransferase
MQITLLQKCHTPAITAMTRAMMAEGKYAEQRFDEDRLVELINEYIEDDYATKACFLAECEQGEVVGMFVTELAMYPFRRGLCVHEIAFYVTPEYRGSSAAARLITRMQEWAEHSGADTMMVAISSPYDAALAESVYERVGFTKWGTLMRKEL